MGLVSFEVKVGHTKSQVKVLKTFTRDDWSLALVVKQ